MLEILKDIKTHFFKRRIYLDYASATPVNPQAHRMMQRFERKHFGNPSALHHEGLVTRRAVREARKKIATGIGARSQEIIFTSGGTESNNLAIGGVFMRILQEGKSLSNYHALISAIEHSSVFGALLPYEKLGLSVTRVPVNRGGIIDLDAFKKSLRKNTTLVSINYGNSEIGTIQPIREISKIIRRFKKSQWPDDNCQLLFHTDAIQAVNYLLIRVAELGVDLMTISSPKIYGPKGAGALYVRDGISLAPLFGGGGQEEGRRPGTENVSAIVGFGEAFTRARELASHESIRLRALQEFFIGELLQRFPTITLNGSREHRLPNNVHISFPNLSSEQLVIELDAHNVAVSAKSACSMDRPEESDILEALYADGKKRGSIRFSFGRSTKKRDLVRVLRVLAEILPRIERGAQYNLQP